MKSILLVFIAVLIPTITTSQLNSKIWSASAFQAASGFADGTNQAYLFHYGNTDIFARWGISPNEEAWKNKWVASLITYAIGHGAKTKKWYWYLADTAIMFTARSVGFYASYNLIFK